MEYEERFVCFIDLLGFKSAINQTVVDTPIRERLYEIISDNLSPEKMIDGIYANIPALANAEQGLVTSKEAFPEEYSNIGKETWPLHITQFSDSFVLSCPENNSGSIESFLKAIYAIKLTFFHGLGMLMRGGIAHGKIIHETGEALFGPAMNEAYKLESEKDKAQFARICMTHETYKKLLSALPNNSRTLKPIFDSGDFYSIDLVSIYGVENRPRGNNEEEDWRQRFIEI